MAADVSASLPHENTQPLSEKDRSFFCDQINSSLIHYSSSGG